MPPFGKTAPTLPDGVEECQMGGNKGYRGIGGPASACHLHDGSPAGMAAAIAKAKADVGTTSAPGKPPRSAAASKPEVTPPNHETIINSDRSFEGMLETVDIDGVDLLSDGGPIHGTGSPPEGDFFSQADLAEIVAANAELAGEVKVPIKIGHSRGQRLMRASGLATDEMPAGGWVENVRSQGGRIVGDYKRVPRKLAALIQSGGFRSRSVELSRVTSQAEATRGKIYPSVITAVALLGAKAPAVRTLDDVLAWYAEDESRDVATTPPEHLQVEPNLVVAFVEKAEPEKPAAIADTTVVSTVADTAAGGTTQGLSDEQITSLAQTFGIEEDDAEKRREAVLAKFSEHAPAPATTEPPVTTTTPATTEPPAPAKPADATPVMVTLSQAELDKLRADAETGRSFAERSASQRIQASVDVAIRQGRLEPARRAQFLAFGERDEQLMLDTLVALPVNTKLFAIAGADDNGAPDEKSADEQYRAYAAMTGVAPRPNAGGSA